MSPTSKRRLLLGLGVVACLMIGAYALVRQQAGGATYERMKAYLDSIPAIDTHEHLHRHDMMPFVETDKGRQMTLYSVWKQSYYPWINPLSPWKPGESFDRWWARAKDDFGNARATTFYRYQLPAFRDLYGVDFDTITDEQARDLNDRIAANYKDEKWVYDVVTKKANIELIVNDPHWERLDHKPAYPFEALVLNVSYLIYGFHESSFGSPHDNPYDWARKHKHKLETLDDYVNVLDQLFKWAKGRGAVCLKSAVAYNRTLDFQRVSKGGAAAAWGKKRNEMPQKHAKAFQDFIMWEMCRLGAKHGLPFQIHTGHARLQDSSPMLLVPMIEGNHRTKFILLHGGYPWVDETGAIAHRHRNVWVDSVWLPTISYNMAKRAFHEWLDVIPSDRIMWGGDSDHAEGIYGAAEMTRRCLAEVLAERVDRGQLKEGHARRIGLQIMRENALAVMPRLREMLWRHDGKYPEPPAW